MSEFEHAGYVYVNFNKGMYGLAQAGMLASELLAKILAKDGFKQTPHTPGPWSHHAKPIQFTLVVEFFLQKVREETGHKGYIQRPGEKYEAVSVDWNGELFCGIKLKSDYQNRTVDLSMPVYTTKLIQNYLHPIPKKTEHQLHYHVHPQYGTKVQLIEPGYEIPLLQPDNITELRQIIRAILHYARAVDVTLMTTLNELASAQSKGIQANMQATRKLMDYCHTHSDATIIYCAIQMQLHTHSNESYL